MVGGEEAAGVRAKEGRVDGIEAGVTDLDDLGVQAPRSPFGSALRSTVNGKPSSRHSPDAPAGLVLDHLEGRRDVLAHEVRHLLVGRPDAAGGATSNGSPWRRVATPGCARSSRRTRTPHRPAPRSPSATRSEACCDLPCSQLTHHRSTVGRSGHVRRSGLIDPGDRAPRRRAPGTPSTPSTSRTRRRCLEQVRIGVVPASGRPAPDRRRAATPAPSSPGRGRTASRSGRGPTRCGRGAASTDRRPTVARSSMSPMLHTNDVRHRRRRRSTRRRPHLQPAGVVLAQDREEAVVGVLPDAPSGLAGRVVEDPEQDERVGGQIGRARRARRRASARSTRPARWPSAVSASRYSSTVARHVDGSAGNRFGPSSGRPVDAGPRCRSRCPPCDRACPRSARRRRGTSRATPTRRAPSRSPPSPRRGERRSRGPGGPTARSMPGRRHGRSRGRSRGHGTPRRWHGPPRRRLRRRATARGRSSEVAPVQVATHRPQVELAACGREWRCRSARACSSSASWSGIG